jgi:O-antigen ligase
MAVKLTHDEIPRSTPAGFLAYLPGFGFRRLHLRLFTVLPFRQPSGSRTLNVQARIQVCTSGWETKSPPTASFPFTRGLLLMMLFSAPLAFGAVQAVAWASLSILASLLLLLWVMESARIGRIRVAWSPLYVIALAFVLVGLVQLVSGRSLDREGTREALLKLTCDCIVFFVAVQVCHAALENRVGAPLQTLRPRPLGGEGVPRSGTGEGVDPSERRETAWQTERGEGSPHFSLKKSAAPSRSWPALGLAVTIYSFLLALFATIQFFSSKGLIYWHVKTDGWVFGPYVNHNDYAGLMEMLIPVSLAYIVCRSRQGGLKPLLVFGVMLAIVSVLLSGSRGGCIALLSELAALAGTIVWLRPRAERLRYAGAGLIAMLMVAALAVWLGGSSVSTRLISIAGLTHSPEVTLGNRLVVGRDTLRMFRDHPWLGTGLGSFAVVYPQYQSFPTDTVYEHAHDDYLEALAETGVLGGGLVLFAVVLFFRETCIGLRARLRTGAGWIQHGAALGCCGIMVHSFVDFNLHIPANALWFAFLLGVTQASRR